MMSMLTQVGDEILDVNGQSLINVSHQDTIKMLKSSDTLMLTVRVEEVNYQRHDEQLHIEKLSLYKGRLFLLIL